MLTERATQAPLGLSVLSRWLHWSAFRADFLWELSPRSGPGQGLPSVWMCPWEGDAGGADAVGGAGAVSWVRASVNGQGRVAQAPPTPQLPVASTCVGASRTHRALLGWKRQMQSGHRCAGCGTAGVRPHEPSGNRGHYMTPPTHTHTGTITRVDPPASNSEGMATSHPQSRRVQSLFLREGASALLFQKQQPRWGQGKTVRPGWRG